MCRAVDRPVAELTHFSEIPKWITHERYVHMCVHAGVPISHTSAQVWNFKRKKKDFSETSSVDKDVNADWALHTFFTPGGIHNHLNESDTFTCLHFYTDGFRFPLPTSFSVDCEVMSEY